MPVSIRKEGVRYPSVQFKKDAHVLLRALARADDELSILLCNDERITVLNAQWRGKPEPTDVLSFPMGNGVLGDLVISVPTAMRQAEEAGHTGEIEMRVLLVHGVLHLCGHDHHSSAEDAAMRRAEAELLARIGVVATGLVARASSPL